MTSTSGSVTPGTADFVRLAVQAQVPLTWMQARIDSIQPGSVTLSIPVGEAVCTAGTGLVMGGMVATLADVAAGVSIISRLDPPRPVTTLGFTSHQIAPARGERIVAIGRVDRIGRRVAMAGAEVLAEAADGTRTLCARLVATFALA